MKAWGVTLLAILAAALQACAHYSTSATGGSGLRSIAIPLFENESLEPEIHQALTDTLIEAFVADGALRVVDEGRADAVLRGTVVEVRDEPFTYQAQAEQYQIVVFVDVTCQSVEQKTALWEEKRLRGFGIYSASERREDARAAGLSEAFRMLTKDIVDRTQVGGW
jgi:hypothetical protein